MIAEDMIGVSQTIATTLAAGLTAEGLVDPQEQEVIPHSYMTEQFAWHCSLLYSVTGEEMWLDYMVRALESSLSVDRSSSQIALESAVQYHWEFKNLSLIAVLQSVGYQLAPDLRTRVQRRILQWDNLNIDSTNWTAMRAVMFRLRYSLFGAARDLWRSRLELGLLLTRQTHNGFFPDTWRSYSFQYHAYTLALLGLLINECGVRNLIPRFLAGVALITDFIDPDGDFNYFGRGQRQLFGYVSLLYALAVATSVLTGQEEKARYAELLSRVFRFVQLNQPDTQWKRIVLNDSEDDRLGWYDYNLAGDYLAFAGVYLLLAARSLANDVESIAVASSATRRFSKCYQDLGLGVISTDSFFAVVSSISREPAEPFGLVHMWPQTETCFGGPSSARTERDYSLNYIGPLDSEESPLLVGKKGRITSFKNGFAVNFENRNFQVRQEISFSTSNVDLLQSITVFDGRYTKGVIPLHLASSSAPNGDVVPMPGKTIPSAVGWKLIYRSPGILNKGVHEAHVVWNRSEVESDYAPASDTGRRPRSVTFLRWLANRFLKFIWIVWVRWTS